MAERKIGFNFNDTVEVTLRPRGEQIYRDHYAAIAAIGVPVAPWKPGETKRLQLHDVCRIFGSEMELGFDPPIETEAALIRP